MNYDHTTYGVRLSWVKGKWEGKAASAAAMEYKLKQLEYNIATPQNPFSKDDQLCPIYW